MVTAAPQTAVSIPDASANTSETVMVPVSMIIVTNLGAATIWLSYDNSVVIVESVSDGDLGSIMSGINNTAGVTKMSWFSATGMTGDFVFAYVTLNADNTNINSYPNVHSFADTIANTYAITDSNA